MYALVYTFEFCFEIQNFDVNILQYKAQTSKYIKHIAICGWFCLSTITLQRSVPHEQMYINHMLKKHMSKCI